MKLVHPQLSKPICFKENIVPVLILEEPIAFRSFTTELIRQSEGESGEFVLSINDKPIDCADHMNVFYDYAHLDDVEKRLQTKAMNSLVRNTQETMADETFRLSLAIREYMAKLAALSDHPVSYEQGENLSALLKAMEFRIDLAGLSPCEALYEQMLLIHSLSKGQCFVLINAHSFFGKQELDQLYKMIQYRKIPLMLLENHAVSHRHPCENVTLFDEDMCELSLDSDQEIG